MTTKKKRKPIPILVKFFLMGIFYFLISMLANYVFDGMNNPPPTTTTTTAAVQTTTTENPVYELLYQANVYLQVTTESGMEIGSGVVIDVDENYFYAITCAHVLDGNGSTITDKYVKTFDEIQSDFEILAADPIQDIALIRFEASSRESVAPLLFSTASPTSNQEVIAFGNPYGIFAQRYLSVFIEETTIQELELVRSVYAIDGTLPSGYSGGALTDTSGNLLGINAWERNDVSYAITIDTINQFLSENHF